MRKIGLLLGIIVFLVSCSYPSHDHTLRISATTWIGYTPLFYAKEKGWLKSINVKLINVVSLSENMYLYGAGNSDAYCGTQYEHSILKSQIPDLIPIMLFDRSNGGDMIMSNHSVEQIINSTNTIDVYLEMDSINFTVLNDFIQSYKIDESRINYIDRDQTEISVLKNIAPEKLVLIITYIPFDTKLRKNGFKEILSTKNGLELLVIDALYTQKDEFVLHKEQFTLLKQQVDNAIAILHSDPNEFYQTIKPYMNGMTFKEFTKGLDDIEWINNDLDEKLRERMSRASFSTKDIL